jgi:catechol 2,3-dioxygenase-like lactoylglutathione lyase family enzyme
MDLGLGRIGQIAQGAADIEASIKFYTEVMGLRIALRPQPGMVFFDCAGQYLLVEKAQGGAHYGPGSVLYFDCHDLALCVRELEARGVTFTHKPHRIAQMPAYDLWMAFFEDPDKHLLALQMRAPKGYEWPKS